MRAKILACMISSEGPDYPEHAKHFFYLRYSGTPKHRNMLGNSLQVVLSSKQQNITKHTWGVHNRGICQASLFE